MKWLWIGIALAFVLAGYAPQLRTRYTPRPALQRARRLRIWSYQRPRWAIAVAIVRVR
jgi:hypothetical protein